MSNTHRLQWGCGHIRPADWINADAREGPGIHICCDIVLDGLPLQDGSIDYISSQHILQTLEVYYLWTALDELFRVLRPGGVLRMGLPDLDKLIHALQHRQRDALWCWDWDTLSGNCITQLINYGGVRTPLNYEFTEELLRKAGFQDIRLASYRQTTSPYPEIVELDSRPGESFYVEAVKPAKSGRYESIRPGPASQIHLSWTHEPSTSVTIVWHTPLGNSLPFVEYRQAGTDVWQCQPGESSPSPGGGVLHRATVMGLSPDTEYEYRVTGDEGERGHQPVCPTGTPTRVLTPMSKIYCMRTAPSPGPADIRFAFLCDTGLIDRRDGNATGTRQIIDELVADRPLFLLGGGDYAYANRDDRYSTVGKAIDAWFVQMQPILARFPLMAQYGNHEIHIKERFRDWAPRFAHPPGFDRGKNYSFDVGDAHFTALFVPGPPPDAGQLLWLDSDLAQARNRGMRWLIVYQHEPIYGHGHSHPARPEVRRVLAPIFEKHQVDLHLSGHDQNYERTYPLMGVPEHPTVMSDSPNCYEAGKGVIYAKISPGGKMSEKRNDFSRFTTEQQPFMAKRDDTAHHYALITVRAIGELTVDVYQVIGDGAPKRLYDSFRIVQPR